MEQSGKKMKKGRIEKKKQNKRNQNISKKELKERRKWETREYIIKSKKIIKNYLREGKNF